MMPLVVGLFAIGMGAMALESMGAAVACFGIAVLILRYASS
jgi:hypothetical protein